MQAQTSSNQSHPSGTSGGSAVPPHVHIDDYDLYIKKQTELAKPKSNPKTTSHVEKSSTSANLAKTSASSVSTVKPSEAHTFAQPRPLVMTEKA